MRIPFLQQNLISILDVDATFLQDRLNTPVFCVPSPLFVALSGTMQKCKNLKPPE